MKKWIALVLLASLAGTLLALNPSVADYREHVRREQGLAGTLGMAMADLLAAGDQGAIRRDNYLVASRFYLGGEGLLPRRNLAWGFAGTFWDLSEK